MRFPTLVLDHFGASANSIHWQARRQQHLPITPWLRSRSFTTALPFKLKRHLVKAPQHSFVVVRHYHKLCFHELVFNYMTKVKQYYATIVRSKISFCLLWNRQDSNLYRRIFNPPHWPSLLLFPPGCTPGFEPCSSRSQRGALPDKLETPYENPKGFEPLQQESKSCMLTVTSRVYLQA